MAAHYVNEYSQLILQPDTVLKRFSYLIFVLRILLLCFYTHVESFNFVLSQIQNIFLLKIHLLCSFLHELFEGFISTGLFQHSRQILRNWIEITHRFEEKNDFKLKIINPIYLISYWTRTFFVQCRLIFPIMIINLSFFCMQQNQGLLNGKELMQSFYWRIFLVSVSI
jgi:hypothetical protein